MNLGGIDIRFLPESFIPAENVHQQAAIVVDSCGEFDCTLIWRHVREGMQSVVMQSIVLLISYCVSRSSLANLASHPVQIRRSR